jgi:hypothetical protein
MPESDRIGDSPDVVDDRLRRIALGDVDPDEHVGRVRVVPISGAAVSTIACLERVDVDLSRRTRHLVFCGSAVPRLLRRPAHSGSLYRWPAPKTSTITTVKLSSDTVRPALARPCAEAWATMIAATAEVSGSSYRTGSRWTSGKISVAMISAVSNISLSALPSAFTAAGVVTVSPSLGPLRRVRLLVVPPAGAAS